MQASRQNRRSHGGSGGADSWRFSAWEGVPNPKIFLRGLCPRTPARGLPPPGPLPPPNGLILFYLILCEALASTASSLGEAVLGTAVLPGLFASPAAGGGRGGVENSRFSYFFLRSARAGGAERDSWKCPQVRLCVPDSVHVLGSGNVKTFSTALGPSRPPHSPAHAHSPLGPGRREIMEFQEITKIQGIPRSSMESNEVQWNPKESVGVVVRTRGTP